MARIPGMRKRPPQKHHREATRERSSKCEVVALRRALRLVRARRASEGDFGEAVDELYAELDASSTRGADVADLLIALVRVASVLTLQARIATLKDDESVLRSVERGLIESSLDIHDHGED